jgi:hypothetical protein
MVHEDHPWIAIGFVAVPAKVAGLIPFLHVHAADKKAAHFTKPESSLEKRIGCTHWNPL